MNSRQPVLLAGDVWRRPLLWLENLPQMRPGRFVWALISGQEACLVAPVKAKPKQKPLVGVIMGSQSDWETLQHTVSQLEALGVPYEAQVVSAHRTPDLLFEYASAAESRGIEVIIAGAGGAAHLPGMCASKTSLPVLGVPVESKSLKGMDSLLSIVQMPGGIPVGTLAIGKAGAINAALLATAILGGKYPKFRKAYAQFRKAQTETVLRNRTLPPRP